MLAGQEHGRVMSRIRSLGLWIACAGLVLQAVGLACDALLHQRDVTLSARESALGLDSPAHLTIAVGLIVMTAGLALALVGGRGLRLAASRSRVLSIVPGAVLAVVLIGAGASSFARGAIPTTHVHAHGAGDGHHHDDPETLLAQSSTARLMKQIVDTDGTEAA